ncbi:MAG: DHH family phosphoesterase [Tannerella sp.]|jgi:phosphoesterase RecJ-like protein|nr:DHH family phosphoesterase [Tannerella sp.]
MLTKIFEEKQIHKLQAHIDRNETFVIVTHLSPDGDAVGSSLGLYHYLLVSGKDSVNVIVPNEFPAFLKWMPGAKDILVCDKKEEEEYAQRLIREADVIFCLDFNELKRIGKLGPLVAAAEGRIVMIDHHLNPGDFAGLVISCPELSSTSEMVFRLICALRGFDDINREGAECIYTGMMTDTGGFTYHANDPALYLIIQELLKKGIDKDAIYQKVYQVYSEHRMRLMGYTVYKKMMIYPQYKAALLTLSRGELIHFRYIPGDTEGFVNLPLSIEGVDFAVFMREDPDYIKISLRSTGDFPCNAFAAAYFNGGGHKNASGGEFFGSLYDAGIAFEKGLQELNPVQYQARPAGNGPFSAPESKL